MEPSITEQLSNTPRSAQIIRQALDAATCIFRCTYDLKNQIIDRILPPCRIFGPTCSFSCFICDHDFMVFPILQFIPSPLHALIPDAIHFFDATRWLHGLTSFIPLLTCQDCRREVAVVWKKSKRLAHRPLLFLFSSDICYTDFITLKISFYHTGVPGLRCGD